MAKRLTDNINSQLLRGRQQDDLEEGSAQDCGLRREL